MRNANCLLSGVVIDFCSQDMIYFRVGDGKND